MKPKDRRAGKIKKIKTITKDNLQLKAKQNMKNRSGLTGFTLCATGIFGNTASGSSNYIQESVSG